MKQLLKGLDAAVCDSRYPVNLLAMLAIFTLPSSLEAPTLFAIVFGTLYRQVKREPDSLKSAQWWRHPSWQRIGTYGMLAILMYLIRSAADANLFSVDPTWIMSMLCSYPFITANEIILLFALACVCAVKCWPINAVVLSPRVQQQRLQRWTDYTYAGFLATYFCLILAIAFVPGGVGEHVASWLVASARDARLLGINDFSRQSIYLYGPISNTIVKIVPPSSDKFAFCVQLILASVMSLGFWSQATRLAGLLTTFCKRLCGRLRGHNFGEVLLRTLREPRSRLKLRSRHPFLSNAVASLGWLIACYLFLFWIFGCSSGPLGRTISSWLDACLADAKTGMLYGATANPHLRMFCGAIVALYATVPFAVTSCVFLPYCRSREMILNDEGILLPDGINGFSGMRLWTDFAHVDLRKSHKQSGSLVMRFHSGGQIELGVSQLSKSDLEKLLSAIDEHASECIVTDAVVGLRADVRRELNLAPGSNELGALAPQAFQSTIFVPHEPGSWLPDGESRIVRLLASRPLSCVYLVRMQSGKLAIAKQFFLAEHDEQTLALRKCFEREYELLSKIEHKAVSRVLDVFHHEQSTYLLVDHASGLDLKSLVSSGGAQSEELVIDWALQVCDVMNHLHSQDPQIIHRDLTPDNVIVADDGSIRVIDFGAAHQFLEGITGTIIGKQCYVSAEQLRGHAGPASDIYSFGCLLYFLLTANEPVALVQCIPSSIVDMSTELDILVKTCTEFEEAKRPQSFTEIKEWLLSIRTGSGIVLDISATKERFAIK